MNRQAAQLITRLHKIGNMLLIMGIAFGFYGSSGTDSPGHLPDIRASHIHLIPILWRATGPLPDVRC